LLWQSARRPLSAQDIRSIVEAELPRVESLKDYFVPQKQFAGTLH